MYEIGLAHAIRQPSEIVMVRADNEILNFDIAGIRIQNYDSNELGEARKRFAFLCNNSIKAIDQKKGLIVDRTISKLDEYSLELMHYSGKSDNEIKTLTKKFEEATGVSMTFSREKDDDIAFGRLVDLCIIECTLTQKDQKPEYQWTPFGKIILKRLGFR